MIVNPFWFGVLVTLVVEMVLLLIAAFAMRKKPPEQDCRAQGTPPRQG